MKRNNLAVSAQNLLCYILSQTASMIFPSEAILCQRIRDRNNGRTSKVRGYERRECLHVTKRQQLTTNQMYEFTIDPGLALRPILEMQPADNCIEHLKGALLDT